MSRLKPRPTYPPKLFREAVKLCQDEKYEFAQTLGDRGKERPAWEGDRYKGKNEHRLKAVLQSEVAPETAQVDASCHGHLVVAPDQAQKRRQVAALQACYKKLKPG